ncbi:MAG: hypothetical protein NC299_01835 [Lachnospiraceae bacterium]|nr:hypothetical protein [Ruminococcus sp.]MCM1274089.1 hypothetical protein [Lachnospiraceae bacterium]
MSYSIPDCFMIAFAVGLVFGLVYEALRIVRLILRFGAAVFVCDIAFFMLAAAAVFRLSESLGSYVRIYTVLGFGAGVFAYIVTVGRLLNLAESAASIAWRKTIGRLIHKIGGSVKKLFGTIAHKSTALFGKISEYFANARENRFKRLHLKHKTLYNGNRLDKNGEGEEVHVIKARVTRSP